MFTYILLDGIFYKLIPLVNKSNPSNLISSFITRYYIRMKKTFTSAKYHLLYLYKTYRMKNEEDVPRINP